MSSIQSLSNHLKSFKWPLLILGLLVVALASGWYFWHRTYYPGTDDAYLNAHVVRIAAQVGGPVSRVEVSDQQAVRAGDLLLEIDPEPFKIALQQANAQLSQTGSNVAAATAAVETARAQVNQAQAAYDEASKNARRILALVEAGSVSKADGDHAEAQRESAAATVAAALSELQQAIDQRGEIGAGNAQTRIALARVAQARLELSYTQLRASVDGIISNFSVRPGNTVAAGQPLFALVDTSEWWIDANFKETDLQRILPGQSADISVDLYPGTRLKGEVQSISPASGAAFSLLPPENATGNWVKVTQRFPVRIRVIDPDPALALRVGASSSVTIDTRDPARVSPEKP